MSNILLLNSDASPVSFLPLTTVSWKEAINLTFSGAASVLEYYDDWFVHSPSITIQVPSVIILSNFVKYQRMVQFTRKNVFLRDEYSCRYCGFEDLSGKDLTLDHVIPKFHGGKTNFTNIITACNNCNLEKSHYMKMTPKEKPKKPTYHELVNKRKQMNINIPSESWIPYLNWNPEKLFVNTLHQH